MSGLIAEIQINTSARHTYMVTTFQYMHDLGSHYSFTPNSCHMVIKHKYTPGVVTCYLYMYIHVLPSCKYRKKSTSWNQEQVWSKSWKKIKLN